MRCFLPTFSRKYFTMHVINSTFRLLNCLFHCEKPSIYDQPIIYFVCFCCRAYLIRGCDRHCLLVGLCDNQTYTSPINYNIIIMNKQKGLSEIVPYLPPRSAFVPYTYMYRKAKDLTLFQNCLKWQ